MRSVLRGSVGLIFLLFILLEKVCEPLAYLSLHSLLQFLSDPQQETASVLKHTFQAFA